MIKGIVERFKNFFYGNPIERHIIAAVKSGRMVIWDHRLEKEYHPIDGCDLGYRDSCYVELIDASEYNVSKPSRCVRVYGNGGIVIVDNGNWSDNRKAGCYKLFTYLVKLIERNGVNTIESYNRLDAEYVKSLFPLK